MIRFVDGKRRVGSGYRIAGRFVLTAAHCVRGSGLRVWLPDGERDARVVGTAARLTSTWRCWKLPPRLVKDPVVEVPPISVGEWIVTFRAGSASCVAVGYPRHAVRAEALFTTAEVDGWIPAASGLTDTAMGADGGVPHSEGAEGTPPLPLPTSQTKLGQSSWAGMSGAAVFARTCLWAWSPNSTCRKVTGH